MAKSELQQTHLDLPVGYTSRPAAHDDAQIVTDLLNAESVAAGGAAKYSLEECFQEWTTPDFNLAASSQMVFAPDGRLAGYAELWDTDEVPTLPFLLGATHPEFWNQGLGSAMLAWGENLARRVFPRVPHEFRVAAVASAPGSHDLSNRLLQEAGMTIFRVFRTMRIDFSEPLPSARLPEGITIKNLVDFGDPWPLYATALEAFEDHFGFVERSQKAQRRDLDHRMADPSFDPTLWLVALSGDEVAGVSLCYPRADEDPTIGYVYKLGVRRPFRRRGIAQALLKASFDIFGGRPGYEGVQLNVDSDNRTGAVALYEKAGMHLLRETRLYEKVLRDGRLMERR